MRIIEIGARMGGDRIGSDLVYLSTGYDYLKMVLQVSCGEPPEIVSTGNKKVAYIRFIFDEKDLYILRFFQKWYKDKIYYLSEIHIDENKKIIDSGSRYGYFILVIDNIEQLGKIIERYKLDLDCY